MKKTLLWIIIIIALIMSVGWFSKCAQEKDDEPIIEDNSLNALLSNASGEYELDVDGEVQLVSSGEKTLLGGESVKEIVIDGWNEGAIRAIGTGSSIVKARNNATLVFRNLTLINNLDAVGGAWWDYLWFGGGVRFENCKIEGSIYITGNARAEFENCTFNSIASKTYSVWVADGNASFYGCTFTGYRGLKIHEFEGGDDVVNVEIDDCLFYKLSEKPGLAIGEFFVNPAETTIAVRDSRFEDCAPWDSKGSLVGVSGFYECDTPLENFNFIKENNSVKIDLNDDKYWTKNY